MSEGFENAEADTPGSADIGERSRSEVAVRRPGRASSQRGKKPAAASAAILHANGGGYREGYPEPTGAQIEFRKLILKRVQS